MNETSRDDALLKLTTISDEYLYDSSLFYSEVIKREELMSTGLGFEVAFPHSKNEFVIDFFLTIGISSAGINWNSFDGKDVKLIFLIGGLVEQQEQYLNILATLSNLIKKQENKERLLAAKSETEFYEVFTDLALKENQAV